MSREDGAPYPPQAVVSAVLDVTGYRARVRALHGRRAAFSPELALALRASAAAQVRRDPRQAREVARLGLLVASAIEDAESRVACLRVFAEACTASAAFRGALRAVDRAIAIQGALGDALRVAELEALRIPILGHLERQAEAQATGCRVLEVFRAHGNRAGLFRTRMALADVAYRHERPREALRHLSEAEVALSGRLTPRLRAVLAVNRGNALEACNRHRAASRQFALARRLFHAEGSEHTVAQIDYDAAYALFVRGRYDEALRGFARAEEPPLRLGNERRLAQIALTRAEIHLRLDLPEDAEAFAIDAERRFRRVGLEKESALAAQHMARAAALRGDEQAAQRAYERAEYVFARLGLVERTIGCLVARAQLATSRGRTEEARQLALVARQALEAGANAVSVAAVALLDGRLCLEAGLLEEAEARAEETLRTCRDLHAPWASIEAWRLKGRAHAQAGDLPSAIHAHRRAIDHLERHRGGVSPDEDLSADFAGRGDLYAEIVDLLVQAGDAERAFEFIERAKSQALVDLLARRTPPSDSTGSRTPMPRRVRYLRERLAFVCRRLAEATLEPGASAERTMHAARAQAEGYEREIARLLRTERLKAAEATSLRAVGAPDLEEVRRDLDEDCTLVEYFLSAQGLVTVVVDAEETVVVRQDVREETLRRLLERFHIHLAVHQQSSLDDEELLHRATRANLQLLANVLLDPIALHLRGKRLIIVPHGILHHLPFHALPWQDGWVTDLFEVVYTPSAAVYGYCGHRAQAAGGEPCIFGLPDARTPEIEAEARQAAERLGSDHLHLGDEATLDELRCQARDARVVHIATQRTSRLADPMLSSIRLADRGLELHDLYGLQFGGELVVLSTCENGDTGITGGDGIVGLARGFLYAGARALLTSFWRVRGAVATELVDAFYERLNVLGDAAAAHRAAMAEIRRHHPHPRFWAPFFLMGRPAASASPRSPDSEEVVPEVLVHRHTHRTSTIEHPVA